ncbi:MAG: glycosyltransferase family 4 protein [Balneolaceae bacterium]
MKIVIVNKHLEDKTGGSELQCDVIARELSRRGHEVFYLAMKSSGVDDGALPYRVVPLTGDEPDVIADAIQYLAPDLVYWRYNTYGLKRTLRQLRKAGIPVIFSVSDRNDLRRFRFDLLIPSLDPGKTLSNWQRFWQKLNNYKGLFLASGIANQCKEFMGLVDPVPEIYFPNSMLDRSEPFEWPKPYCAWVANLKDRKQPEAFIRLVEAWNRRNPDAEIDFLMAGEIQDRSYEWIRDKDRLPENLHYLGELPAEKANGLIAGSLMLVHTCRPEGFPNIFIQSWYYGRPVVSLSYDPDRFLKQERIGYHSISESRFLEDVSRLIEQPDLREEMGERAARFARKQFNAETNIGRLEAFMQELAGGRS